MNEASKNLQIIIEEEWEFSLQENPVFATRAGDHRFNNMLPKISEQDYTRRLQDLRVFRDRLHEIKKADLSKNEQLTYEIFDIVLLKKIQSIEFKRYRMPVSKVNGFHLLLPELQLFVPLNTITDYNNYIARLEAIPDFIDAQIANMKLGLKDGQIAPRVTMIGVIDAFKMHTNSGNENRFFKPFTTLPATFTEVDKQNLIQKGQTAIETKVLPAYNKFIEFLDSDYLPKTREDIAAINLPDGEAYYQHSIWYHTSLNLTAKEIHEIGQSEVKRIRNEMEEVLKQVDFKGSFQAFIQFLRTDSRFYVSTAEELLAKSALVCKRMDGQLPKLFKTLPRLPYGILPIPDYQAPGNYTAYYQQGTGDGTRSGTYYVNTYDLKSRPTYEIEALTLHESVPGHHLQLAIQLELDLPNFRKWENFNSFVEGWALYTERLGLETGFYTDPYSNFGRLSYEMWRASRLVVDTGMHALGWTRQQAIDFMAENTSLSLLNITNEVDRYISWPGQALGYKLGELKIRELRSKAEKELGDKFDLRIFHDEILKNGSIPLNILEEHINEFIENIKEN